MNATERKGKKSSGLTVRSLSKQEFGRRLLDQLRLKGWNQSQLGRYAGIGRDNISQYIRGRSFPSPANLEKLASALSVPAEELLPNNLERTTAQVENPETEYRSIPGDPDNVWLRINRRVPRAIAIKILTPLDNG